MKWVVLLERLQGHSLRFAEDLLIEVLRAILMLSVGIGRSLMGAF